MTSKDIKTETSDLEALRKEAEYYRNLIKQHESKQLSLKNNPLSRKVYGPINDCNKHNAAGSSNPSSKLKNIMYSGQPAVTTNYIKNRTVINHSIVSGSSLMVPGSSKNVASVHANLRNNIMKKNPSVKCESSFSLSNVPKHPPSTKSVCNLIPSKSFSSKSSTCSGKAKDDLLLLKQRSNSNSKVLYNEIIAMTNKLKEASKTMVPKHKSGTNVPISKIVPSNSSRRFVSKKIFINPSFSKNSSTTVAKIGSNFSEGFHSFSTPKSFVRKGVEILPRKVLQNHQIVSKSLVTTKTPIFPRTIISKTPINMLKAISVQNSTQVQKVLCVKTAKKSPCAKAVCAKKATTRLVSSKFKLVNKKSPTLTVRSTDVKKVENIQKLPLISSLPTSKGKLKLVSSKYKIVNKKSPVALRRNSLKFISPKSPKMRKNAFINKNHKFKINKLATPVKSITGRCSKSFQIVKPISKTPRLLSSSLKRSKYKIINETSASNSAEKKKVLKISPSGKVFNFPSDMDVDLLMELAAEKKSQSVAPSKPRKFLLKRVYKTKNMLVNKNVSSPQVKTAQMIKSKYLASNRKHVWLKQARSRKIVNCRLSGTLKRHQTKFFTSTFHQRQRNSVKNSRYINPMYSKNLTRLNYAHRVPNFASPKKFKRISTNHSLYKKISHSKYSTSTPVSKILASRVLQHSISRVLTASSKKTSKTNTYCMFYNRFGRCNKGTQCLYIHDPSKIAICTRFLRGTCKKENCSFSHEISPGKMAICSFYLSGSCTKPKCPYRHEKLKPGAQLCKAFVKGYCPKGKQCQKAHVLICPEYVQGSCSKGDACAFPHPPPKEKKANSEKIPEKVEGKDSDELLMERVSRYFEPSKGEQRQDQCSANLVVPQRINLPEQPSFISLSLSDNEF